MVFMQSILMGEKILNHFDAYYANGVISQVVDFGEQNLTKGKHKLEIEMKGANPSAVQDYMFGIDYIDVLPLTTGLHENIRPKDNPLKICPNPFVDELKITGLNGAFDMFCVYDLNGVQILSGSLAGLHSKTINTSGFKTGSYFINFDKVACYKVIKG